MQRDFFSRLRVIATLACILALDACRSSPISEVCESELFLIDRDFEGGAYSSCQFLSPAQVEIVVEPENSPPINPSPWYAFRVNKKQEAELTAYIRFVHGKFRYWPKLSANGRTWERAEENRVQVLEDGSAFEISLDSESQELLVAAQPLFTGPHYEAWMRTLERSTDAELEVIGYSPQGRPLQALLTFAGDELVVLLGRQHPPEVSGALAMKVFINTLLADTDLARRFRDRYSLFMVPLLNPDGVAAGHWRHNAQGVDLNRDWGIFSQPETAAVFTTLERLEAAGKAPEVMLDFHSTRETLFYTQLPEESPWQFDFASAWFERVRQRVPTAVFEHAPRSASGQDNTKNFFFARYGIPALTYELGDEESQIDTQSLTPVFAEEFMRLLLDR